MLPAATPPPPAEVAPPPSHANVALVAAAPEREEIAVPVLHVPNAATSEIVVVPAISPPAIPADPAIKSLLASFQEPYPSIAAPYEVIAVVTNPPAVPAIELRSNENDFNPAR